MSSESPATPTAPAGFTSLGRQSLPVGFGEQVITSLLYNHDANPVHHKPDHAVQWMLGLFSGGMAGVEESLAHAGAQERTYTLGAELLRHQDIVVMPGIILSALCYEHFIQPEELTVSLTSTFTYPLLVPTMGTVEIILEGWERREPLPENPELGPARRVIVEAYGPGLMGSRPRLMKLEVLAFPPGASPDALYGALVAPEFTRLGKLAREKPDLPMLSHPAAISGEDARRYCRMIGMPRPITPAAWQAKIPRVLTEVIDHLRAHAGYQAEVKAYYAGRRDEAERREAIERYVRKELKYRHITEEDVPARIEGLAAMPQLLYARQYVICDPRRFLSGAPATAPGTQMRLDLSLFEARLRRGLHRFFTGGRIQDVQVFMGEAMVTGQPLLTRELASFLCEINYSFETLRLFEYRPRA